MREIVNMNPGLVLNGPDGTSCFLACSQMLLRTSPGRGVLSFAELGKLIHKAHGQYSWEYGAFAAFADMGFQVRIITTFDLRRLCDEGNSYMYEYFGKEAAEDQIQHSDMEQVFRDVRLFLEKSSVCIEKRVPQLKDVGKLLSEGFYLIPYVNQRILQADPGYVAHTIFVYGFSERGVRMHNPGPPATENTEIAWTLFDKAWSSPREASRILFAAKPPLEDSGV
jgi:hypothetical protein